MKSSKRIHLVSYEKWARENVKYKQTAECEFFSENKLPQKCPDCYTEWKKGANFCTCGYTVVSKRQKPLYKYFNRSYDASAIDEGHNI